MKQARLVVTCYFELVTKSVLGTPDENFFTRIALESTNGKKGNENVFVADSIADAKIPDSRNSNWTAVAHVPRRRLVWRREEGN